MFVNFENILIFVKISDNKYHFWSLSSLSVYPGIYNAELIIFSFSSLFLKNIITQMIYTNLAFYGSYSI